jgi:hypothetical protein
MLVKNSDNQSFIHANDAPMGEFVELKLLHELIRRYEAVYAYIETANNTLVERVVTGFPQVGKWCLQVYSLSFSEHSTLTH